MGGVLETQGKLTEAQAAFEESLAICRRLAEQDPNNAGWQSDLAVAYNRVGGCFGHKGNVQRRRQRLRRSWRSPAVAGRAEFQPTWTRKMWLRLKGKAGTVQPRCWRRRARL